MFPLPGSNRCFSPELQPGEDHRLFQRRGNGDEIEMVTAEQRIIPAFHVRIAGNETMQPKRAGGKFRLWFFIPQNGFGKLKRFRRAKLDRGDLQRAGGSPVQSGGTQVQRPLYGKHGFAAGRETYLPGGIGGTAGEMHQPDISNPPGRKKRRSEHRRLRLFTAF
ncbi:hypothetical protein SDC9_134446 [bioreactor metagenome]|uniref:Uncharacterized protein n=1 Tax=bioreactor metagenome TaxID=1076179 RepID=A0A645DCZ0_9ZZZZ